MGKPSYVKYEKISQVNHSELNEKWIQDHIAEDLSILGLGDLILKDKERLQTRAEVRVTIEKMLDQGLPRAYTPELFDQKTTAVFQHVYDAYYGAGHSVYAMA
ncbi:MAG: hypothetical protein NTU74_00225 [Deltaproteobacteria bacterium]|nr:hypothetical protein [Deltaproteobacteria bacterium]